MFWIKDLLRIKQWYKNVIAFAVIFFTGMFLSGDAWLTLLLAFVSLCMMSSVNYIINDYKDIEKDKLDPVKGKRPLPSGKVSKTTSIIIAILLFIGSIAIAYFYINKLFVVMLFLLFVLTQFYTFWLKNVVFFDVIMIAINFMIRAVAGAIAISVYVTEWFVIGIFFLAMFLVFSKRYGEAKDGLQKNRRTLSFYTEDLTKILLSAFLVLVIILYALYIILNYEGYWFMATVPVFTLVMLRYFMLALNNSDLARHAEKLFLRKDMILGGLLWLLLFTFAIVKAKYGLF